MGKNISKQDQRMRLALTQLAAKIIAEEGVEDFLIAKRKAAERLGSYNTKNLPNNQEIQLALSDYRRLFHSNSQSKVVAEMRATALEALAFFEKFRARITGPILDSTIEPHQAIVLHLFCDSSTEIALFLLDHNIPYESKERCMKISTDKVINFPAFVFLVDDFKIELIVMPEQGIRQAPLSPIDGKPAKRLNLAAAQRLFSKTGQSTQ